MSLARVIGDHAQFPEQLRSLLRLVFSLLCPVLMWHEEGILGTLDTLRTLRREYGISNAIFAIDFVAYRLISSADTYIRQQFQICHRLLVSYFQYSVITHWEAWGHAKS